ncbi:membrane protein insertion efficiency factor YidD [Mycolicibacterium sp.]|uniref:membrane protein insertion efficiency factor YidD n=1 Tax=Mycolicibacterium sp. TaxID=2320850 RepID=UPI003D13EA61
MTPRSTAARALVFVIQLYRHTVSPLRLPTCRFTPTCSQYAVDALTEYGFLRGSWLTVVRLAKCGPWHTGGWDPIPERDEHGGPAECACGPARHPSTEQQGESQTRV